MHPNSESNSRGWLSPFVYLSDNWISLAGVVIVTTAVIFWLFLLPVTLKGTASSPYIGILVFLGLPAPFFLGLIMVPLGIWLKRKREGRRGVYPPGFPPLTWRSSELRKLVYFVGATTFINIAIASQLTYGAVNYMDSVTFCGETCHTVMQPEFTAYQNSPHSSVECVKCHIGPGAGWFVRSKLSGVGQVFAVTLHTYPTPIPTPVRNLRPARETCEQCHWPQKYGEDRIKVVPKFADDEKNSLTKTVLLMKIGGGNNGIGIHGTHLGANVKIQYQHTDEARQVIPCVEYNNGGKKTVYANADVKLSGGGCPDSPYTRTMDCMDCHNRPAHSYDLPERAVDKSMNAGLISAALPFAKKTSVEVLKGKYLTRDEAAQKIPVAFAQFYQQKYPDVWSSRQAEVRSSADQVLAVYMRNVFPEMKVNWGVYPINIGHTDFPGCFRCHDGSHASKDGASISQDCNACHNLLAMDETNPKILTDLGVVESKAVK
jgi:nitrate/TMAO reductase-like tetraheme cytochrome c subunit